ncbi:hypothetical protein TWF506_007181 [Arthrobotrys conoides]|uniref:BTB domain-containing protein n=1 Tax=Arthrobotrys conoides TaxID=74498 RepID=A0AAN8NNR2_9PEZI
MDPEVEKHYYSKCPDIKVELYRNGKIADRVYGTSAAIRNVSDVFNRMLDPDNGFRALPADIDLGKQLRVLSLPDDDAEAMLIIFKIIHYETKLISKTLSYQLLVELAVVCDKYNCARILHPWPDTWIPNLINTKDHDLSKVGQEDWLLIGHIFPAVKGVGKLVYELSAKLAKESYSWSPDHSEFRRYTRSSSDDFSDELDGHTVKLRFTPDRIIDHIMEESKRGKRSAVENIRSFCAELDLIQDENVPRRPTDAPLCGDYTCPELATGSVIRSIKRLGLSISQISNPGGFDKFPLWVVCRQMKVIAASCKTIIPWTISTHPVLVLRKGFFDYITYKLDATGNMEHLQAGVLKNPIASASTPPSDLLLGSSKQERCIIARKAREIAEIADLIEGSISGFTLDIAKD